VQWTSCLFLASRHPHILTPNPAGRILRIGARNSIKSGNRPR
jgi:hypothetical protein